ncbi:hypothetical protein B0J13DRAFT_479577 [Dactylonectria estremocensis]|uniref:Hemerythrin-like domain-containing protein n=1 Tax=Dactylonectria estremocensis TaxID=1079267 RepID=A0A9P9EG46_9HYPO|nr:hypothetical protein B0J13DRAFT_479577 [Dactylonectria estremocensis]
MAPVYADHPFPLVQTPNFKLNKDGKTPDLFDDLASLMGVIHNAIICGLNSIYLQAPYIKPADERTFCTYMLKWHEFLCLHHYNEETDFFPSIESLAGEKGLMDLNVQQHHAFHDGLDAFSAFVRDCQSGKEKYDGRRIVELIDSFGPVLVEHLAGELPTLQGLRKYGDKMNTLPKVFDDEGEKTMKALGLSGMYFFFANQDLHYEEDLWASFPPAPGIVKFLCRNVVWWFNTDLYKFGSCDRHGSIKPLYAAE